MRSIPLAPNPDHQAAALSYRRARNALIHSKLSPWMAERELESLRFWRESAEHHKSMAEYNATRPVRTWSFPTWRDEVNWLFRGNGSPDAAKSTLAGVE
jgi:hypothetical protein